MLKSASKLGFLLAAIFLIAGGAFIATPQEMTVHHAVNQKGMHFGRRSGIEVVGRTRSQIYGGGLVVIGLIVGAFSLYKPRA